MAPAIGPGVGAGFMRRRRGAGGGAQVVNLSMPALLPSFDVASQSFRTPLQRQIGIITPVQGGTPSFAISGAQSAGFEVDATTGALRIQHDFIMLGEGARNGWGANRSFTVTATISSVPYPITVNVALDTSMYGGVSIPGVNTLTGRRSTNPLKDPVVESGAGRMSGWTVNVGTKYVTANTNNPTPLVDFDLRGWWVWSNGFNGCSYDQCLFGFAPGQPQWIGNASFVVNALCASPGSMTNCTIDCQGRTQFTGAKGSTGLFVNYTNNIILDSPGDCMNFQAGTVSNVYARNANTGNMTTYLGTTLASAHQWDHGDGIQTFNLTAPVVVDGFYLDNRFYAWDPETWNPRSPAGTVSIPAAAAGVASTMTGTGTSWQTGAPADRLNVGDAIYIASQGQHRVVTAVASDTSATVSAALGNGTLYNGPITVGTNPLTGVTSPIYADGVTAGVPLDHQIVFRNGVARGGSQPIRAPQGRGPLAGTVTVTAGSPTVTGVGTTFIGTRSLAGGRVRFTGDATWYDVLSVASNTSMTLATNAGTSLAGVTFEGSAPAMARTIYENNLISDFVNGIQNPTLRAGVTIQGNRDTYTLAAVATTRNPNVVTPSPVVTRTGADYVNLSFAELPDTIYEVRTRTTIGPGAWSSWGPFNAVIGLVHRVDGLATSTGYDFEVRCKNTLLDTDVFAQISAAAFVSATTTATPTYDADATALFAAMTPLPSFARRDLYADFITGLKTDAIWSTADGIYLLAATNANHARQNIRVAGTRNLTVTGSPTFVADGYYTGWSASNYLAVDAYKYIFSGLNAAQNNNAMAFFELGTGSASSGNLPQMGNANTFVGPAGAAAPWSIFSRNSTGSNDFGGAYDRPDGLVVNSRIASGAFTVWANVGGVLYANPTATTVTRTSVAGADSFATIGGSNGGTGASYSVTPAGANKRLSFAYFGAALDATKVAALNARVKAYLSGIGAIA